MEILFDTNSNSDQDPGETVCSFTEAAVINEENSWTFTRDFSTICSGS